MINNLQNTFRFFQKQSQLFKFYNISRFSTATADGSKQLNYYELLEVARTCTQKDIKQSFLRLAKIYHPDVYKGDDTDRFRQIKEAYETLRKPALRKKYDQQMRDQKLNDMPNYDDFKQEYDDQENRKKQKGDFSFDGMKMGEKQKQNMEEEYRKFFEEPINISPEEVVTHDNPYERQMGYEERVRYEYAHIRNNMELYTLKHIHQKGYEASVNDTIQMMNAKNIPDSVLQAQEKKQEKKWDRNKYIILLAFIGVSVPFFISFNERKRKIRDNLIKDSAEYLEYNKKVEIADIQDRMRFEHKHQEQKDSTQQDIEVDVKTYQWQKFVS